MSVNSAAAYGMYPQEVALHDVVHTLNQAGFENEDICMMLAPTHPIATIVREASILNTEREASAVTAGLIGWLSEFGAVVIPTVGFFIRSQAFFHALVVAKDAPALCGSTKTLVGLGFPKTMPNDSKLSCVRSESWSTCPARRAQRQAGRAKCFSAPELVKPLLWKRECSPEWLPERGAKIPPILPSIL